MKTSVTLTRKSVPEKLWEHMIDFAFKQYCFCHTLWHHPRQMKKVYWSISDCYIEIGKSGYISHGQIFDLNGEITPIREVIISLNQAESMTLTLSAPELSRIEKIAEEQKMTVKELILSTLDKLQVVE